MGNKVQGISNSYIMKGKLRFEPEIFVRACFDVLFFWKQLACYTRNNEEEINSSSIDFTVVILRKFFWLLEKLYYWRNQKYK